MTDQPAGEPGKSSAGARPGSRRAIWIGAVLVLVTLLAYWPVRKCGFVTIDDDLYVTRNSNVLHGLTLEDLRWAFTTRHTGNWHPLTWISHMTDCQVFGVNPAWHHTVNLLFHAANCLLLFLVLRLMTGAVWRSALVAALFAWHPMHVESVAWVSERKDVLSTFFGLLAMGAYVRYAQIKNDPAEREKIQNEGTKLKSGSGALWYYGTAMVFYAMSLMSKSMLVTLPFVLLLLDYWPLRRSTERKVVGDGLSAEGGVPITELGKGWGWLVMEKLPFLALAAISSFVAYRTQAEGGAISPTGLMPIQERLCNVPIAYVTYIQKLLWPTRLCVLYPFMYSRSREMAALAVMLLLIASGVAVMWGRGRRWLAVGWFWFLGTLVPVIGFVQVGTQTLADRYSYIPYVGLFIIVAWGLADVAARIRPLRPVIVTVAVCALIACVACTRHQIRYWKDSLTLFDRALAIGGDNLVILTCQAKALMEADRYEEAVAQIRKSLEIRPYSAPIELQLGYALEHMNRIDEALQHYRAAASMNPSLPDPFNNLAWILATTDDPKLTNATDAVEYARRACSLSHDQNARFVSTLAAAYAAAGRYDEAIATLHQSSQIAAAQGDQSCIDDNQELLQCFTAHVPYHQRNSPADLACDAAHACDRAGDPAGAIAKYREALDEQPDHIEALNNLAWLLATDADATNRNGAEAVRLATRACELTHYKQPFMFGTLGAAEAECGQFEMAASNAAVAARMFTAVSNTAMAATNEVLVRLYESHQPFRQAARHPAESGAPKKAQP
jgi:Flp pilus assembly protein TadD